MKINTIFLAAGALFIAIGCAREMDVAIQEVSGEVQTLTVIGPAPIQFESITGRSDTKGTSVQDGSALLFSKRKKITCFILEAHLCGYR